MYEATHLAHPDQRDERLAGCETGETNIAHTVKDIRKGEIVRLLGELDEDAIGESKKHLADLVGVSVAANPDGWVDCNQVERSADVPGSTVRHFLFTFLQLGLLERLEMHGGYRYRLSPKAEAQPYFRRLQDAAAAIKP